MSNKKLILLTHYASTCPHVLDNHVVRVCAAKKDLSNKGHIIAILGVYVLMSSSPSLFFDATTMNHMADVT